VKILHINKQYYVIGGTDTYFFGLTRLLEGHGHTVVPFSTVHPANEESPYAASFIPDIETAGSGLSKIKNLGRVFYSPAVERRVRDIVQRERPDIAHVHHLFHKLSPSVLVGLRREGVPVVMTIHDFKFICPFYMMSRDGMLCQECRGMRYWHAVQHKCIKQSRVHSALCAFEMWVHRRLHVYEKNVTLFLLPSMFLADKLREDGFSMPRMLHIPNFADTSLFSPHPAGGDYILFFGKLEKVKGVHLLLEALSHLSGTRKLSCRIAGVGTQRGALEAGVTDEMAGRVMFLGQKSGAELRELIRNSICVVAPTIGFENGSMTIIEAMCSGRPVIASRCGGNPEYVEDGITGLLFTSGDARDLAKKLDEILSDPARAEAMGAAARHTAMTRLSPAAHYDKIMRAYQIAIDIASAH